MLFAVFFSEIEFVVVDLGLLFSLAADCISIPTLLIIACEITPPFNGLVVLITIHLPDWSALSAVTV